MKEREVRDRLERALQRLRDADNYLLGADLNERCIGARLAMHLRCEFVDYAVDVEYNRAGATPKRLGLLEECADSRGINGERPAVPLAAPHRD